MNERSVESLQHLVQILDSGKKQYESIQENTDSPALLGIAAKALSSRRLAINTLTKYVFLQNQHRATERGGDVRQSSRTDINYSGRETNIIAQLQTLESRTDSAFEEAINCNFAPSLQSTLVNLRMRFERLRNDLNCLSPSMRNTSA